jgi:hypothetical protein
MGSKNLTAEERAAYRALARAAARLRKAQEQAEQKHQANSRRTQQPVANAEGRGE